ncbi:MAG: hypothetical protein EAZ06_01470 [Cytophagales bacterium]|nr:MAG: hypothetical protein EAZ06_01470 [Cytophagales bacterium]
MNTIIKTYLDKSVGVIENENQVWFMAKDVFEMLDLSWRGADSLWQRQIPKEWAVLEDSQTVGGVQKTWFINERAIYKLAFRSNKPEAEKFTNWVAEVAETIRKTGSYQLEPKTKIEALLETVQLLVEHEKKLQEQQQRIENHETRISEIEGQINTVNKDYLSLAGYYALKKQVWNLSQSQAGQLGKKLKKASEIAAMPIIRIHDSKFGEVNGYHKDILAKVLEF